MAIKKNINDFEKPLISVIGATFPTRPYDDIMGFNLGMQLRDRLETNHGTVFTGGVDGVGIHTYLGIVNYVKTHDYIDDKFLPVIDKIREVLVTIPGQISVEGHTDDIPIAGGRYRSNWTLSSARAAAFAEELFVAPELDSSRFQIVGHADTRPLVPNVDPESRARNRRVEIVILRTHENDDDDIPEIQPSDQRVEDAVNARPEDFELSPNEIF